MPHSMPMQMLGRTIDLVVITVVAAAMLMLTASCSGDPGIDTEFPPGNPAIADDSGDNPVLGTTGTGAIAEADDTSYGLLVLIALLLIAAGVLLVKVEAWERRRSPKHGTPGKT